MLHIDIPADVEEIINRLNANGHEAYAVGGCVRDTLLGREPGDWDITTSASPYQVKALFRRTIDTGIQHGTVTIMKHRVGYEVTTYRIDGEYTDGRHPDKVEFTSNLSEDLKRRDFTINAMAYSHKTGIVDLFHGMEDLKNRRITCVGRALDRFTEDALRILRAIRFSAQLGFSIEEETRAAITKIAPNLVHVSKERVQVELTKLLLSDHPEKIREVYDTGISEFVSPAFAEVDFSHMILSAALPTARHMRWAAFLKDSGEERAVRVLKDLKSDNDTILRVRTLVRFLYQPMKDSEHAIRLVMKEMSPELFDDLLVLKEAVQKAASERAWQTDEGSQGMVRTCSKERELSEAPVSRLRELTKLIRDRGDCVSLKTLAVTGRDLIAVGVKPGKEIGDVLERLLQLVLENPEKNQKDVLMEMVNGYAI